MPCLEACRSLRNTDELIDLVLSDFAIRWRLILLQGNFPDHL